MDWVIEWLKCKKCGNHILCGYHANLLKVELKNKLKETPKPKCVGC